MERSAIVDECIALIAPDAQHETECRRQIGHKINVLCWLDTPKIEPPPELLGKEDNEENRREWFALMTLKLTPAPKADREALLRFVDALAALTDAVAQLNETRSGHFLLSLLLPAFDAVKFSKELETLVTIALKNGRQHKGGMPFNKLKLGAACCASLLIEDYGTKPPTLTIGGPYYELASVLYGAATGEREADLSRHCKWVRRIMRTNEIS
jgi:hypothetical protein